MQSGQGRGKRGWYLVQILDQSSLVVILTVASGKYDCRVDCCCAAAVAVGMRSWGRAMSVE
jgi:hypothetical protein